MNLFNILTNKENDITSTINAKSINGLYDEINNETKNLKNDIDMLNKKMRKQAWCNARMIRRTHLY